MLFTLVALMVFFTFTMIAAHLWPEMRKLGWNEMLAWLRSKRWQSLSFGGIVYLVLLIPVVNLLMMPAAVAGATLFWVRERGAEALLTQKA
jgi:CysZ protein